jgi:hypothetical protein
MDKLLCKVHCATLRDKEQRNENIKERIQEINVKISEKIGNKNMEEILPDELCTFLEERESTLFLFILRHQNFEIKKDFIGKARFIANGQMADLPKGLMYPSMVARDRVGVVFLLTTLNDVDILAAQCL